VRSFIIHMSASVARAPNARALLAALPEAELIEAVDGRDAAAVAGVVSHPGTLLRPRYPFPLRPAEIGVFQSHRKCWQRIVDGDLDHAIVAEDDLSIDPPQFDRALALIAQTMSPEMVVRLPVKQRERPAQVLASDGDLRLILPKVIGLQCICQVVGRAAAERLLAATEEIDRPVDTALQMHWATGQPVHTLLGTGNREIASQIGGSTIQTKTRASGKLAREIRRAWYRAQVALRPQRP
jgi:GR25 family glycosyltransferase involved in LPS biosynthesis